MKGAQYPRLPFGLGSQGSHVRAVQFALGLPALNWIVNGKHVPLKDHEYYFGPVTRFKLAHWQRKNGLPATGVCDQKTWARLVVDLPDTGAQG